jgi:hypothetical protein
MTQLVFAPTVNEIYPFQAFCAVLTGWRSTSEGAKSKALRFLIELEFNRRDPRLPQFDSPNLDLNAAILTLDEIALNFTRLASTLKISTTISNHLLSDTDLRTGYFGLWFAVRNHMLEQVVDLSEIDRLAGSVSRNDAVAIGKWQSPNSPFEKTWGQEIAKMLDDLLEGAGYRGVTDRFNFLR